MNKKIKILPLIISALIPLAVGFLSSLIVGDNFALFKSVEKPSFAPPSYLFGIVWTILYILLGISFYLVKDTPECKENMCLHIYIINLFLNFFWSVIFFNYQAYLTAFFWIILLWLSTIWLILAFSKSSRLAGLLNVPYLLWITFAAVLNFSIYLLN